MARTNNLTDFLTDVANAIREKKGTTDKIPVSNFDTEIASIEGGGTTVEKGLIINSTDENGFATDVSIVGMTGIPSKYLYYAACSGGWLSMVGSNLKLPSELTIINSSAFYYCEQLAITELPDNITHIWDCAFEGCNNLALSKLPSSLTHIGNRTFFNNRNLAIKEIPEGVTGLYTNVFGNCTRLTEITCQGKVVELGTYTFNGCTSFEKLVLPNITIVPTLRGTNAFINTKIANATGYIYVPDDLVESFKTATNWSTYADQIKGVSELV